MDAGDARAALVAFADLVTRFRSAIGRVEASLRHESSNPDKHAEHIKRVVRPAMGDLRELGDELEMHIADDLWTLPKYREMLAIR